MRFFTCIYLIFLTFLNIDARSQCYKASGRVSCPTDAYMQYGVKVRLMDKDALPWEADDEMGIAYTDEDGNYTVSGCGDDFGIWWNDPDPYIYIDHRCPEPGKIVSIAHRYKTNTASQEAGKNKPFDYDDLNWLGEDGAEHPVSAGDHRLGPAVSLLGRPGAMGNLENLISESYKFIRMADDLNNVASYMNDIRWCFIALTITVYVVIVGYIIVLCVRRNRRTVNGRRPRTQWDYQIESQTGDTRNTGQTEDLIAVRSETSNTTVGVTSMGHRNHRNPPSFMRHSGATHVTANHQGLSQHTTRLVTDRDGTNVKHQIPHITTEPPSDDSANQQSLAGSKLHHRSPVETASVDM